MLLKALEKAAKKAFTSRRAFTATSFGKLVLEQSKNC